MRSEVVDSWRLEVTEEVVSTPERVKRVSHPRGEKEETSEVHMHAESPEDDRNDNLRKRKLSHAAQCGVLFLRPWTRWPAYFRNGLRS